VIRVGSQGQKTPHPRVGTPAGGDNIEHPHPLNPPSAPAPAPVTVTDQSVTVTPPSVTVTPKPVTVTPSVTPVTPAALRQRKSRAARKYQRIAVPCHPDHLAGLDV